MPYNPQAVLSKLDVVVQTPKQSPRQAATRQAQTPRKAYEFETLFDSIGESVRKRRGSSIKSFDEQFAVVRKGALQIAHEMALIREEMSNLREAFNESNKRKSRKRRYVRTEETLTAGEVQELLAEQAGSSRGDGEGASKRVRGGRRCGRCKQTGHNTRTCAVEIDSASDSGDSGE